MIKWNYFLVFFILMSLMYDRTLWLKSLVPCLWHLLSSLCSHHSPGVWQRAPALPKWRSVHQKRPLQLSRRLHRPAVREAPLRNGAGGLPKPQFGPCCADAPALHHAAAASGLSTAERGPLLAGHALKGLLTWSQWRTHPHGLHLSRPPPLPHSK